MADDFRAEPTDGDLAYASGYNIAPLHNSGHCQRSSRYKVARDRSDAFGPPGPHTNGPDRTRCTFIARAETLDRCRYSFTCRKSAGQVFSIP